MDGPCPWKFPPPLGDNTRFPPDAETGVKLTHAYISRCLEGAINLSEQWSAQANHQKGLPPGQVGSLDQLQKSVADAAHSLIQAQFIAHTLLSQFGPFFIESRGLSPFQVLDREFPSAHHAAQECLFLMAMNASGVFACIGLPATGKNEFDLALWAGEFQKRRLDHLAHPEVGELVKGVSSRFPLNLEAISQFKLPRDYLLTNLALEARRAVNLSRERSSQFMPKSGREKVKVLFLASNPAGTSPLGLEEEAREIETKIRASEHRDCLQLLTKWAVRPDDLIQYLNQEKPHVVHFSGHGSSAGEIILLDQDQKPKPVNPQTLPELFSVLKDNVRVVVLNACYSQAQAQAITKVIDCAVGMGRAVDDREAIVFAASFYRALGFGRSVHNAFDQAKVALKLEGIPDAGRPQLLARAGVDPANVSVVGPPA